MSFKIELTMHEFCLTIAAVRYIKAEFDYHKDQITKDREKLIERLLD